jgi:anti-anti-sigma regulatory factor
VEPVGTRLVMRVHGELGLPTAPRLRAAMLKCLVDQPDALVVDLTGTVLADPAAASVFLAVSRQAAMWPGTPLMIAAPEPGTARLLTENYRRLAVFASIEEALAAEPQRAVSAVSDVLLPVSGAGRRARDLATEACARWGLDHLIEPAATIANELAVNASVHARTMADIRFTLGQRYLTVAVRDGSTEEPRIAREASADPFAKRGLLLVDMMAHRWGSVPVDGGKVVWAALLRGRRDG